MKWKPIETAPEDQRVIVCGWQKPSGGVSGYWWWEEDIICNGSPMSNPNATYWIEILIPPFPSEF